jgi:MarR family transcriptional regulator, 2-MHQ and catechol-resistance regulon repressor
VVARFVWLRSDYYLTLKNRRKRGSDTPSRKKPQDRDEQSQRQTGRRHENVDAQNIENDGAQDRKRQRNVPICQKKQRGHDLQQEKHNIQARDENRAQELPGNPGRRRQGNEVQKPVEPEGQEDNTKQITRARRNNFHAPSSSTNKIGFIDIISIDIDISDVEYNCAIHNLMENRKRSPSPLHTWLIMLKSWQSIGRYLRPTMSAEGLGESDFRLLEVLLHKGPMPVNAIGPKVDLNPGSVSVAVDRLYKKGFVSRVECSSDRRIRTVALTEKGREMFVPLFRRHAALITRAFQDVSPEEMQQLEGVLKKIGKRAESLAEKKTSSQFG